ncbi:hypothetical protein [Rhizobium azibense]|uniref:Uncharacterized protein n=1 Tax=Rhizobium azibense TaxID=1136135 RepID=A0A4R3RR64_9HYPH|nr:hypothetical protein [Rhizobium azibense]TCU34076.1 hypothetical protein EV129_11359 [Rhizobium azibense]
MSEFGHFHATAAGIHLDTWGAGSFEIMTSEGIIYRFEVSDRFGPQRLDEDGDIADEQFGEGHAFWSAWGKWKEQGRRVDDDGVRCLWDEEAA